MLRRNYTSLGGGSRLSDQLTALEQYGLALFGGRRQVIATGGLGPPLSWWEALLVVRRADQEHPDAAVLAVTHPGQRF